MTATPAITSQQIASIDWNDVKDILCHGFTVIQMAGMHPKLFDWLEKNPDEKSKAVELFINAVGGEDEGAKEACRVVCGKWMDTGLFTVRPERFCRKCRKSGHTRTYCSEATEANDGSAASAAAALATNTKQKFQHHLQELERQRLIEEKLRRDEKRTGGSMVQLAIQQQQQHHQRSRPQREGDVAFAVDERRRGVITRVETARGYGMISVHDCGEVRFFLDRADFGIKDPCVNDVVTLKLDLGRDMPTAIEVRPEKQMLTPKDVIGFLDRCRVSTKPMKLIETILMHMHEWVFIVSTLVEAYESGESRTAALNALVAMVTFAENREPVHLRVIRQFLHLMATPCAVPSTNSSIRFFPELLIDVIHHRAVPSSTALPSSGVDSDASSSGANDFNAPFVLPTTSKDDVLTQLTRCIDDLSELANLVFMYRQHSDMCEEDISILCDPLRAALQQCVNTVMSLNHHGASGKMLLKRCGISLAKIEGDGRTLQRLRNAVFPSAEELSLPPPLAESPFAPANLPKNVVTKFPSAEALIEAQWKLLRADTFEATCRVLAAACFTLPHYTPSEETLADVEHCHVVDQATFVGRVLTRDRDFSLPDSYIFHAVPRQGSKTNLASHFSVGSCVCITTGLDRTIIDPQELFWGLVSSADSSLLRSGCVVITPCEGSDFTRLLHNVQRNQAAGQLSSSMMLEAPIFVQGYRGIVGALLSFVGPGAMTLPMSRIIVDEQAPPPCTLETPPVAYIPPHGRFAFERLVEDVRQSCLLDPGQDEAMRSLSTSELILVQGPPGTGKSFIGARIVEVYIRYKQLMASGDILNTVDINALPSVRWDKLAPKLGPVVVITYKNHALDEFLLDLMRSGLWNSERQRLAQTSTGVAKSDLFPRGRRLVRVGGRSKETALADYNLNVLINAKMDKSVVYTFRDRIYTMNSRLERLAKEIQLLERGKVPRTYFEKFLTDDQRSSIRFEDREDWLAGKNYIGTRDTEIVDSQFYLSLLRRSDVLHELDSSLLATGSSGSNADRRAAPQSSSTTTKEDEEEEDIQRSVFQEMRREDEYRDTNENLHNIFVSSDAMQLLQTPPKHPEGVPEKLLSLWSLSPRLRHIYYAYLIQTVIAVKVRDYVKIMDVLVNTIALRNHAIEEARLELLQGADIIGFTTTGCAMHQNLLRSLKPSILVVEEAAEVLESQLLACITDSLKQIVLIGDHYQLKPKVDTFMYEKVNHLNVSMFERLANRIKPIRLVEQRRMHPLISALVRPFYDGQPIEDHESVVKRPFVDASGRKHYDFIPGLGTTRLTLWEHNHPEEMAPNSRSKINTLELSMSVHLVEHLVNEGVHPNSITVITPYLGQCRAIRNALRLRANSQLRDIRVSTVDLFQGDENDIVILSMVRTQKLTEFLRMRNRMIVSCSRARFAFVIIGNSKLLEQSSHWKQVLSMLRCREGGVSEHISLSYGGVMKQVKNTTWMKSKMPLLSASASNVAAATNEAAWIAEAGNAAVGGSEIEEEGDEV